MSSSPTNCFGWTNRRTRSIELRELTAFREVARQASFSRAALHLGYVQSTVSAQIAALERELGARLFDRLGRTVVLTPAGRSLLPHAERILDLEQTARSEVTALTAAESAGVAGSVVVSAPESLLTYRLPAILRSLRETNPAVHVDLRPTPIGRFRGDVRRGVATGDVDVALVLDTLIAIPGFHSEPLVAEDISVIAPPTHPLAGRREGPIAPADLDDQPILLPEAPDSGCAYRGQFERHLADRHVTPSSALEFASIEAVKQCVVAGMGVSVLPSVAVEADVAAGRLVRLPWTEPFEAHTQLVWNERRSLGPAVAAFVESARAAFSVAGRA